MGERYRPIFDGAHAPTCDESCPQHDGKRCRLTGTRAHEGRVCEPWADDALAALREIDADPTTNVSVSTGLVGGDHG